MGALLHMEVDRGVQIRVEMTLLSAVWASQLELRLLFEFLLCHRLPEIKSHHLCPLPVQLIQFFANSYTRRELRA